MAVKELVTHLGGKYTHKMSHANSHLILQLAMGDKWRATAKFGVLPVTPEWLVDSAFAGLQPRCQPLHHIKSACSRVCSDASETNVPWFCKRRAPAARRQLRAFPACCRCGGGQSRNPVPV